MEEVKDEKKTNTKKNNNKNHGNYKKKTNSKNDSSNRNNNSNKVNSTKKNVKTNTTSKKSILDKSDEDIEILDKTNSLDIVIDEVRLKDKESLDFSFIDGKRKKKKAKEDIELLDDIDYKEEAKKIDIPVSVNKGSEAFSTALIIIFSFILGFLVSFIIGKESGFFTETEKVVEKVVEEKVVVDDNYVFVGDSIFEGYDLEKYFKDMPVINSGISGHKTTDILNNMNNRIYKYNPSKVILMIGTNDFSSISNEDTVKNIGKIIDGIKANRPYAEIYVQSIYPVNKNVNSDAAYGRSNDDINTMNKGIKDTCKEKEVNYMNIHDLLIDENGNLKSEYTYDGLHITKEGYKVITEEVMKVLKK